MAASKASAPKPVGPQGETVLALVDPNLGKLEALAVQLAKSSVVPMAYIGKPDNIFATIQFGRELGVPPMVALNNIANINGRPSMGTDLMLGICQKHTEWAGYEIDPKSDDKRCEVHVYRKNKLTGKVFDYKGVYTITDAQAAGLLKPNGPWEKYRARMLKHRALSFALRDGFGDALAGLYSYEEMQPDKFAEAQEAEFRVLDEIEAANIEERKPDLPSSAKPIIAPKRSTAKK